MILVDLENDYIEKNKKTNVQFIYCFVFCFFDIFQRDLYVCIFKGSVYFSIISFYMVH